ncbi:MAG: molybdopterin molybdotransferase MoeA [Sulfurovaceae bacterium]|nr:molybdopterin molybdotransferase MoeA [Sulfurovaceae bacterium]
MAVSIIEALNIIDEKIKSITATEFIDIEDSLGRVIANDIISKVNLPKFDNSAMDGYAVNSSLLGQIVKTQKEVIYAGNKTLPILKDKYAIRIMTGAPVPKNADIVVPIEMIEFIGDDIKIPSNFKKGANIRLKGEELKSGNVCIKKGEEINSYSITLLASQGIDKIEVFKKPLVTIFGSGDELKHYSQKNISEFQIYNSNTPMLKARAKSLNCETMSINNTLDNLESLKEVISNSLNSDFIITTGGASVGDKDLTKEAFIELGMQYLFEKIDIKPGKPTSIGIIENTYILILPGNPTAAMINFELFGKFIINKLKNLAKPYHFTIKTKISNELKLKSGKHSVILGYFNGDSFMPLPNQSPNYLSILKDANSLIITKPEIDYLQKNQDINILMIEDVFLDNTTEDIFVF